MLTGRQAFITGSSHGIGLEIAVELARQGCATVLHGLPDAVAAAAAMSRVRSVSTRACDFVSGDLADPMPSAPLAVATEALRLNPLIDTLVCNAGTFIDQPFLDMDYATFDRTIKLNVSSQFVLVQHFARQWVSGGTRGRIVMIGSINGRLSEPTHVAYDTSKGAVEAMVRSLCVSLAPHGVRVNGVAPGLLLTPLTATALQNPQARSWMELHTPSGTVPGPAACAGAVAFLLSDAAEHVHGQMLFVDGGMSIWQQPDPPPSWLSNQ